MREREREREIFFTLCGYERYAVYYEGVTHN